MKEVYPNSFEDFFLIFDSFNNDGEHFYRGQSNADWKLLPGLGRNENLKTKNKSVKNEKKVMKLFKK